jgi:hypothetical protein
MALLPNYEYDIFISYRHQDKRSRWMSEFVAALRERQWHLNQLLCNKSSKNSKLECFNQPVL